MEKNQSAGNLTEGLQEVKLHTKLNKESKWQLRLRANCSIAFGKFTEISYISTKMKT